MLEFDCIVYLRDTKEEERNKQLENLGLEVPEEADPIETRVKYAFNATKESVVEVRQTYVEVKEGYEDAVIVSYNPFGDYVIETPPLLVKFDEFKKMLG